MQAPRQVGKPKFAPALDYKARLERRFRWFGIGVIRFRYPVLLLSTILVCTLAVPLRHLGVATTIESLFPENSQSLSDYHKFRDRFGRDETITILIESDKIFSLEFLSALKSFHEDLENTLPLLHEVKSLVNARRFQLVKGKLEVVGLLDDFPKTQYEASLLKHEAVSNAQLRDRYLTEDNRHTVVTVRTAALSGLTADGRGLSSHGRGVETGQITPETGRAGSISQVENHAVLGILDAVIKEYRSKGFVVTYSGTPVYQFLVEPMMRAETEKMVVLLLAVTMLFMGLLFSRGSGFVLPQLIVVLGMVFALSVMAIFDIRFTLSSSMLPSILLSIGLAAPIHFLVVFYRFQRRASKSRSVVATLGHSGLPIMLTSLTTIAGLVPFAFSDVAPIAQLGLFLSIGVLAILLLTLTTLPALLATLNVVPGSRRGEEDYERSVFNRSLLAVGNMAVRWPRMVVSIFAIAVTVAVPGVFKVGLSHNMLHYFDADSEFLKRTRSIEEHSKGLKALEIVVDSGRDNGIISLNLLRAMDQMERFLLSQVDETGQPMVGETYSVVGLVKEANRVLYHGGVEHRQIPQTMQPLVSALKHLHRQDSNFAQGLTDSRLRIGRLTAMMNWKDAVDENRLVQKAKVYAQRIFPDDVEVIVTGAVSISAKVIEQMSASLLRGYGTAFFLISLLLVFAVGEIRMGLIAVIPNLLPVFSAVALMGYLDIPLNTYSLIGGSIVVGLAVDDTIHFFHNFRRCYMRSRRVDFAVRKTLGSAGRALLTTTLVLACCFFLRLFSDFPVVADFGLVVGISLVVALLADVLLAPALLSMLYSTGAENTRQGESAARGWAVP